MRRVGFWGRTKPAADEYRDNWDRIFGGKQVEPLRDNRGRLEEIMEYKTISIQRFRSPDGAPTCCADHANGQECRFLGVRNFGIVDVCMLGEHRDLSPRTTGFQRPDSHCEVWADNNVEINGDPLANHPT